MTGNRFPTLVFASVFVLAVAVNLVSLSFGVYVPASVAKCFLMPMLCLTGLSLMSRNGDSPAVSGGGDRSGLCCNGAGIAVSAGRLRTNYVLALGLHTLGDILLIFSGTAFFLGGMGAFFAGHIFYLLLFFPFLEKFSAAGRISFFSSLVTVMFIGALAVKSLMGLEAPMALPVCVYAATLISMVWTGLFCAFSLGRSWLLIAGGAALFTFSDTLIGINAFMGLDFPYRGVAVMATYICAQILLTAGIIRLTVSSSASPQP